MTIFKNLSYFHFPVNIATMQFNLKDFQRNTLLYQDMDYYELKLWRHNSVAYTDLAQINTTINTVARSKHWTLF